MMESKTRHSGVGMRKASRSKLTVEERAIPFISVVQDQSARSSFRVTEEARSFLAELPGPLAVVAVTGLYRTGKSYLINRMLLNRKQGFGVGSSINACTKVSLAKPPIHHLTLIRGFGYGHARSKATHPRGSRYRSSSWTLKALAHWSKKAITTSACSRSLCYSALLFSTTQWVA